AAILTGMRLARAPTPMAARSWARRIGDGTRLMAHDRLLRLLAMVQLLAALSVGATSALLVVLAERRLGPRPGGFGLLLGAIGAGSALGPPAADQTDQQPPSARSGIRPLPAARPGRPHPRRYPRPGSRHGRARPLRRGHFHRHGHLQLAPSG